MRTKPIAVAISTGFHSLVELLLRSEQSQEAKDDALRLGLFENRPALMKLALVHGAAITAVPLLDVLMTGNRSIVTSFLARGADPSRVSIRARVPRVPCKTTLGSYLDCRKMRPELAAALQEQADMALRQFCQEGNLKWVSLLMWVGANPRSRGPALDDADHADHPEWHRTALEEASPSGKAEILKRLKPSAGDDLGKLLRQAAFHAHHEILPNLLDVGANPNDKPDGGSTALEDCIKYAGIEDSAQCATDWARTSRLLPRSAPSSFWNVSSTSRLALGLVLDERLAGICEIYEVGIGLTESRPKCGQLVEIVKGSPLVAKRCASWDSPG